MFTSHGRIRCLGDVGRKFTNLIWGNVVRNAPAHHLLDELPQRDLHSLNSQLSSYLRRGNPTATWALFLQMFRSSTDLSAYSFTPVLGACAILSYPERGRQVHALMIKHDADTGTVAKTALIDMYSKYGQLGDSVKVFEDVGDKDVVSWNALLSGFLRNGLGEEALGVFAGMSVAKVEISEFVLCSLVKVCALLKILQQGKQVHGLVIVMGRDLVVSGTALIDFYSSVGLMCEAMKVYTSLNCRVDEVMLNSLISGCVRNLKYREAFSIMSSIRPNVRALTSALAACSENSDLWIGKQIHCVALRHGFVSDTQLCNVILDMYAKSGKILCARAVFEGILSKDVVSWTSMIDAYAVHGHGLKALELFRKMCEDGSRVLPNPVTFLVVLSACAHAGLVQDGRECFCLMKEKYQLDPGPEHYVCFIDILSKAGDIEEIWKLLDCMAENGDKPTTAVWAAILNACSLNMDVSRGEFAAKRLIETDPNNPSNYVLASNFYAAIGKWDLADELRGVIKEKGLFKAAGSSWFSLAHGHGSAREDSIALTGSDLEITMLRALSTRKNHGGYEKLGDESEIGLPEGKLKRVTSVPASLCGQSRKPKQQLPSEETSGQQVKKPTNKTGKTVHPLLSFFDARFQKKKKKATAKPEFARYLEYMKEGGVWDATSNAPVIYYK